MYAYTQHVNNVCKEGPAWNWVMHADGRRRVTLCNMRTGTVQACIVYMRTSALNDVGRGGFVAESASKVE